MSEQETVAPIPEPEEDFKDKYFRALAEMQNMTRRMQKEKQEIARFGIDQVISDFLPVIDNFENALRFAENGSGEVKNWAMGFQMILAQMKEALHNNGIVSFQSEGTLFDPTFHEAVEMVETDEHPEGAILAEFTKGYKSGARVIRPARVKVAKLPAPQEPAAESVEETLTNLERE